MYIPTFQVKSMLSVCRAEPHLQNTLDSVKYKKLKICHLFTLPGTPWTFHLTFWLHLSTVDRSPMFSPGQNFWGPRLAPSFISRGFISVRSFLISFQELDLIIMQQSFVVTTDTPHTYGDGRGNSRANVGAVTSRVLQLPLQCRACDVIIVMQIYARRIYYNKFTIIKSRPMTLSRSPQCRAFSRAVMDEKLLFPLFPIGGGRGREVVTNDWCIKWQYFRCKPLSALKVTRPTLQCPMSNTKFSRPAYIPGFSEDIYHLLAAEQSTSGINTFIWTFLQTIPWFKVTSTIFPKCFRQMLIDSIFHEKRLVLQVDGIFRLVFHQLLLISVYFEPCSVQNSLPVWRHQENVTIINSTYIRKLS